MKGRRRRKGKEHRTGERRDGEGQGVHERRWGRRGKWDRKREGGVESQEEPKSTFR